MLVGANNNSVEKHEKKKKMSRHNKLTPIHYGPVFIFTTQVHGRRWLLRVWRGWPVMLLMYHPLVLQCPQQKVFAESALKSTTGTTSTSQFFLQDIPSFCPNSLIDYLARQIWAPWCTLVSMGKRQQFPWLSIQTSSPKLENVVPGAWICRFLYCRQVYFYCCRTRTRTYSHVSVCYLFYGLLRSLYIL